MSRTNAMQLPTSNFTSLNAKMGECSKYSDYADCAWQATLEGILSHLRGFLLEYESKDNMLEPQPAPKKLTTEAIFMLNIVFIFIILTVFGSSITAIEHFFKEFWKKVNYLFLSGQVSSGTENADIKKNCFEPSVYVGAKSRELHVNNVKHVARERLDSTSKLTIESDVWKSCKTFLECFSLQANLGRILGPVSGEQNLNALHGIKTLTLSWVAFAHCTMFYATIIRTVSEEFQHLLEIRFTQLVVNGTLANNIFFVLSGFLNAYMFFDFYKKKNGKIPWFLFYVSRFLRFTPFYVFILGFYATLFSFTDSGPAWPTYSTNPICRENWIWNLFYLNNFLPHKKQCLLSTWYIACDLQLYLISPIFLLLLMRRPKIGFSLIAACICGSCVISFLLTWHFNLIDGISSLATVSHEMAAFYLRFWAYFDTLYIKTYIRILSYVIGIALGYILFQRKQTKPKGNSLVTLSMGWMMSFTFMIIGFYALYNRDVSPWETAVYNGIKDLLISCSSAWVIFACATGQGGVINSIFSHKVFVPFSRVSFSFYFIHIIALEKFFLSVPGLIEFSYPPAILTHLYVLLWSWAVSFAVSLVFERPLVNLVGLLMRDTKKQEKKEQ